MRRTGECLCGAVKFTATLTKPEIQACHCVQCQKWTGGGPLYVCNITDIAFEDDDALARYRASAWGERVFCATCGSTIMWKMQDRSPNSVASGLLNDQSGLTVTQEIFIDHRPDWLPPQAAATQSTEAQEQAKLAAYLSGGGA